MDSLERAIRWGIRDTIDHAINKAIEYTVTNLTNKADDMDPAVQHTNSQALQSSLERAVVNLEYSVQEYVTEAVKNMKLCPNCQTPASTDKKFCPNCGTKLPEQTIAQGMVCPNCGKQNAIGTKFCQDCGIRLASAVIRTRHARKEKNIPAITNAEVKSSEIMPAETAVPETHSEPVQRIVRIIYTDDEIARLCRVCTETQLLTGRERDVFIEMLKGRKQSEIGYYLGISIPYIKDNARRIYAKFGVANKNELFEKIASDLQEKR